MIDILGNDFDINEILNQYSPRSIGRKIINNMDSSNTTYYFKSIDQFKFEIDLRISIIRASVKLHRSRMSFEVFRKSRCNTDFWTRSNDGGFIIKTRVKPSDAINDIFVNGEKYGTECSTAIVIVYYKALVDIFPKKLFNEVFPFIRLMNWRYIDNDLDLIYYENATDYFPGDCRYFKNPDVNPLTPEWQGENAIYLRDNLYYGHGIGIVPDRVIIRALNSNRKENSTKSAYLLDSAIRPDFKYLANIYNKYNSISPLLKIEE